MPQTQNFIIYQGETFSETISVTTSSGSNQDLTGMTLLADLKHNYQTGAYVSFTCTIAVDPTTGLFTLGMAATDTETLEAGRYVYDVKMVDSASTVTYLLTGIVTVMPVATL